MATVAEALPANAIDEMLQEIAPADLDNEDIIQFKNYLQQKDARQLHSLEEDLWKSGVLKEKFESLDMIPLNH